MKMNTLKHLRKQTVKVEDRVTRILDSFSGSFREKVPDHLYHRLRAIQIEVGAFNAALQDFMDFGTGEKNILGEAVKTPPMRRKKPQGNSLDAVNEIAADPAVLSPVTHKRSMTRSGGICVGGVLR